MTVREWVEKHPEFSGFVMKWAADTRGGFGRKGGGVYGNRDVTWRLEIIREEMLKNGTPVLWLWDTELWGPCLKNA